MSNQSPRRHLAIRPLTLAVFGCLAASVVGCANEPTTRPAAQGKVMSATTKAVPDTKPSPIPPVVTTQLTSAKWRPLFDGKALGDWKFSGFGGQGDPAVSDCAILLPAGEGLTGVTWGGGELPKTNYEITLEAQRVSGNDFFCGLTFPVAESNATLVLGGWGGAVCGISSLNGDDAANNETTKTIRFDKERWYTVRVRVTPDKLRAWLDDDKIVDVVTTEKQIDVRADIAESKPLGLTSFRTTALIRDIKIRDLEPYERGAGK